MTVEGVTRFLFASGPSSSWTSGERFRDSVDIGSSLTRAGAIEMRSPCRSRNYLPNGAASSAGVALRFHRGRSGRINEGRCASFLAKAEQLPLTRVWMLNGREVRTDHIECKSKRKSGYPLAKLTGVRLHSESARPISPQMWCASRVKSNSAIQAAQTRS
jgi:hypothetical protein